MRQIATALFVFTVCTLAFSSCKKESTAKSPYSVTATINGVTKTTTNVAAVYFQNEASLEVLAQFSATESISFLMTEVKTGTFTIASDATLATYINGTATTNTYDGTSGTLTLSSYGSGTAGGTFNFTGTNSDNATVTITSGTFNTAYTSQ